MKRFIALLSLATTVLILAGCNSTTTPPGGGLTAAVTIADNSFSPTTLTVAAGTTVTWTNTGTSTHTVTSDTGTTLNSSNLTHLATFPHVFATAGTFTYHCSIHSAMQGTVIVN